MLCAFMQIYSKTLYTSLAYIVYAIVLSRSSRAELFKMKYTQMYPPTADSVKSVLKYQD